MDQLERGQGAVVTSVGGSGSYRRRLLELGVVPGTAISRTSLGSVGGAVSYRVRGAVLCLKGAEAGLIGVVPL